MSSLIEWDENGLPRSTLFDDKYFCQENGLLESQYIFCGGNQLERRWKNLPAGKPGMFILAETGFGTGLNFLCAWKLWQECAPDNWELHYLSIDKFPLSNLDLTKALNLWPVLSLYSQQLISQYAAFDLTNRKIQSQRFDGGRVRLSLVFDDVFSALRQLAELYSGKIDAWFLDGFAPAKNPDMWADEIFALMAVLSYSGSTLSTFTVAGLVRRGLNAQGFKTEKIKGFGRKRQMLIGTLDG